MSYHGGQCGTLIVPGTHPVKLSLKSVGLRAGGSEDVSSGYGAMSLFIILVEWEGVRRAGHSRSQGTLTPKPGSAGPTHMWA